MTSQLKRAESAAQVLAMIQPMVAQRRSSVAQLAKAGSSSVALQRTRRNLARLEKVAALLETYRTAKLRDALLEGELGTEQDLAKMGLLIDLEKLGKRSVAADIVENLRSNPSRR